jgi:RNA polymerase sigma-70 factor (ECF subfamily)
VNADAARRTGLALFEEHGNAVYRFALALLHRHEDAEDVVQETFVKLLVHVGAEGPETNLRGWLFTVAANACRDRLRRRARWLPWSTDADRAVAPSELPDADGRRDAARHALRQLSRRDRLLVALRAQGLSYRDIAEAAHVRPSSVGRLLARAIARWERACAAPPVGAERRVITF